MTSLNTHAVKTILNRVAKMNRIQLSTVSLNTAANLIANSDLSARAVNRAMVMAKVTGLKATASVTILVRELNKVK